MKKRIISLLLVVSMVLSLLPVSALAAGTKDTAADSPFTDVKPGDWCYDAVLYAKANGFFSGTSETTFSPNGTMTRGMFVTVLGRMAGIDPAKYGGDTGFTDVPEGMYYAPYVKWAAQYGITGGTGDGRFSPDALIPASRWRRCLCAILKNSAFASPAVRNIPPCPPIWTPWRPMPGRPW